MTNPSPPSGGVCHCDEQSGLSVAAIRTPILIASLSASALLSACGVKENRMNDVSTISADIKHQLAFSCTQEKDRIPPRDPEADQLYKHARWLRKGNVLKQDATVYPAIERLIRISAAYGHDKANIELRRMLEEGQAKSSDPVNEVIDLVEDLIRRGIPSGYYDMGWYLEHGYGVKADRELAFKYYRKSADLGSPEGQHLVGRMLTDKSKHGAQIAAIGWAMYQCAANQNHAKAANDYGIYLQVTERFVDAPKYLQIAARAGSSVAAYGLSRAFGKKGNAREIDRLDQAPDPEREQRYMKISTFLHDYEYLNPSVQEIDEIVPLPPAKLPPWDGKFKWLEDHNANVPPSLPTEERVSEMARAKGLDPMTGRPKTK